MDVRLVSGARIDIDLSDGCAGEDVSDLRSRVAKAFDVPAATICLVDACGKPLNDGAKLLGVAVTAIRVPATRLQQLQHDIDSLISGAPGENWESTVEAISNTELHTSEELQLLTLLIFKKVLMNPLHCETYADLVSALALASRLPGFDPGDGGRPVTFRTTLINTIQAEFESLGDTLRSPVDATVDSCQEFSAESQHHKARAHALIKFIGQLYLRSLLSSRVMARVLLDLSCCEDPAAELEDTIVECICELLADTGYSLHRSGEVTRNALASVCARLVETGHRLAIEVRVSPVVAAIKDVMAMQACGWLPRGTSPTLWASVEGLQFKFKDGDIGKIFGRFGVLRRTVLLDDGHTAAITFSSFQEAQQAIHHLSGVVLHGFLGHERGTLRIAWATGEQTNGVISPCRAH